MISSGGGGGKSPGDSDGGDEQQKVFTSTSNRRWLEERRWLWIAKIVGKTMGSASSGSGSSSLIGDKKQLVHREGRRTVGGGDGSSSDGGREIGRATEREGRRRRLGKNWEDERGSGGFF